MSDIYKQHQAAFKDVSAYVIIYDGECEAIIAFKSPKKGAGRLYAYVNLFGSPMVRGYANGFGYDRKNTALHAAAKKITMPLEDSDSSGKTRAVKFIEALCQSESAGWERALREEGFNVFRVL